MTTSRKENVQYITAIFTLFSGILMCFLSFFLTEQHMIHDSVLWYMGQAIIFCSAVFGLNVIIKNKIIDAETRINDNIDKRMSKVDSLIKDDPE